MSPDGCRSQFSFLLVAVVVVVVAILVLLAALLMMPPTTDRQTDVTDPYKLNFTPV